ncbi:DUF5916 domain-containing protein [Planctomycetota bacterium]
MRKEVSLQHICLYALSAFVLLTMQARSIAHDDPNATVPSLRALKVEDTITVDGILDEPFWQETDVVTGFIDTRSGQPAEQQTTVRIAYSRTHLYIAVECFDDRIDELRATERREDRFFRGDDWVEVHLDPAHTHNSKYAFFSNPLGTKVDASEGPSGSFSTSWSAEWDLAAKIYDDRWAFEMSIPLSILNYQRADGQTWGMNFTRKLVRTDVTSFWSYNQTDFYKPRYFGHLTGLNLADSKFDNNLEVTPYVTSRTDINGDSETDVETGVDVSFRLTPSITSSWTVNPDFAQVEADADTIELRDTERFLPEKRLFFREGEELFSGSQDRLYYSRRFTDIDAGARVSGEWENNRFAFIDVYGDVVHEDSYHGNSAIFRAIRNVGEKSTMGLHASDSSLNEGYSRVLGNDGMFYLNEDWRFLYNVAGADERFEDQAGQVTKDRDDYYGYGSFTYERYPWEVGVSYKGVTEDFNPILGFIPRRDIFGPRFRSIYHLRSAEKWYKSYFGYFGAEYYDDSKGDTALRDYTFMTGVTFQNDVEIRGGHDEDYHRPFNNRRTHFDLVFDESDYWRTTEVGWAFGEFEQTNYDELVFGKHFKPIERWPVRYEYVIRYEEEPTGADDTIWLNRVVFDYFFSDLMWIKSSIQHRSTDVHNISVIFGWEFIKDAHLYLVYNGIREEDDPETGHSIFIKLAYTFR